MTIQKTEKGAYVAPELVEFGDINGMTQSINVLGGGDSQFSLLAAS